MSTDVKLILVQHFIKREFFFVVVVVVNLFRAILSKWHSINMNMMNSWAIILSDIRNIFECKLTAWSLAAFRFHFRQSENPNSFVRQGNYIRFDFLFSYKKKKNFIKPSSSSIVYSFAERNVWRKQHQEH